MVQLFKRSVMKEDLICGVAILLYLVILTHDSFHKNR